MQDCLIIGGGIIGLLTAFELGRAGLQVTLIEKGETGRESSWAGGGILSPLYPWRYPDAVSALVRWSQNHYPILAEALHSESGIDPEYSRNGLLVLDPEDIQAATEWARRQNVQIEIIDRGAITKIEPGLSVPVDSAIWLPDVAQIRNPRLVSAVRLAIEKKVEVIEHTQATGIEIEANRAVALTSTGAKLRADIIVVCAGAWTGRLLRQLGHPLPITPVLGQMILFHGEPGVISRILLHKERYVIPRRDGRVLVGSTVEHKGFLKETSESACTELKKFAQDRFPILGEFRVEKHWAGLRPSSPAGIPFIGPYPGIEGLYVNSGHFRNGLVTAPASAKLLADLILDRAPAIKPDPYRMSAPRDDYR